MKKLVNDLLEESLSLSSIQDKKSLEHYFLDRLKALSLSQKEWKIAIDEAISYIQEAAEFDEEILHQKDERLLRLLNYLKTLRSKLQEKDFFDLEEFNITA